MPLPETGGQHAITQTDGRLAWELAAEIADVPTILKRYELTIPDLKRKLKDPMFRMAVREAKAIWKSDLNIQQRIVVKARLLLEDSLLDVFAIIKQEHMPAAQKLEAFEKLMKAADMAPKTGKAEGVGGAGHFKINIILGDRPEQKVIIDANTIEQIAAPQ